MKKEIYVCDVCNNPIRNDGDYPKEKEINKCAFCKKEVCPNCLVFLEMKGSKTQGSTDYIYDMIANSLGNGTQSRKKSSIVNTVKSWVTPQPSTLNPFSPATYTPKFQFSPSFIAIPYCMKCHESLLDNRFENEIAQEICNVVIKGIKNQMMINQLKEEGKKK